MRNFLYKLNMKFYHFMQGRYGPDDFGKFLLISGIILDLISLFVLPMLSLISLALLIWEIFRFTSRNRVKRSLENDRYRNLAAFWRRSFKALKMRIKDRNNHYYLCPECHQIIRIPKGHGKIEITCPKCGKVFTKRS